MNDVNTADLVAEFEALRQENQAMKEKLELLYRRVEQLERDQFNSAHQRSAQPATGCKCH